MEVEVVDREGRERALGLPPLPVVRQRRTKRAAAAKRFRVLEVEHPRLKLTERKAALSAAESVSVSELG